MMHLVPHPAPSNLELYACGDLGRVRAWRVERHVKSCASCREEVARLRRFWQAVDWSLGLPTSRWNELAGEMRANIRVGLSAAECIRGPRTARLPWVAALASVLLVAAAGTFLHAPKNAPVSPIAAERPDILEFVNGSPRASIRTVSADGEMRSRYVDRESDGVTIVDVYAK